MKIHFHNLTFNNSYKFNLYLTSMHKHILIHENIIVKINKLLVLLINNNFRIQ